MSLDDPIRFVGALVLVEDGSGKHAIPLNKIRRFTRNWDKDVQVFVEGLKEPITVFDDFDRVITAFGDALLGNA